MGYLDEDLDIDQLGSISDTAATPVPDPTFVLRGRMPAVSYLVSKYAPLYRLVLDVLLDEERRLGLHLPTGVINERFHRRLAVYPDTGLDPPATEDLLAQLHEWGNVDRIHNTHRKGTYQEYLRKDYLYQLTPVGAQVHQYLTQIDAELGGTGALQSSMLPEVLSALRELSVRLRQPGAMNARDVFASLHRVYNGFAQLSENAKLFVQGLNRALELETALRVEVFLSYKQIVVDYLNTFVLALMRYTEPIASAIDDAEEAGITEHFTELARTEAAPALGMGLTAVIERDSARLREQWFGLRQWFFACEDRAPVASTLHDRAVDAVNRIVAIVRRLNDQRFNRIDRKADLMTLARWFSGTSNSDERARLWRDAFGLHSARHLGTPHPAELGFDVRPRESWRDTQAAPVDIRIRTQGPRATRGRPQSVNDPRRAKSKLAAEQRDRDHAVKSAVRLLAGRGPVRLSELVFLSDAEFGFVLSCLQVALASPTRRAETSDGRLHVALRLPKIEATSVPVTVLHTEHGRLAVIDYELTVGELRKGRR